MLHIEVGLKADEEARSLPQARSGGGVDTQGKCARWDDERR